MEKLRSIVAPLVAAIGLNSCSTLQKGAPSKIPTEACVAKYNAAWAKRDSVRGDIKDEVMGVLLAEIADCSPETKKAHDLIEHTQKAVAALEELLSEMAAAPNAAECQELREIARHFRKIDKPMTELEDALPVIRGLVRWRENKAKSGAHFYELLQRVEDFKCESWT